MKHIQRIANNYSPLPVNIIRGRDVFLWDVNNKKYVDLLAGYSAVNEGHCHPRLVKVMKEQCQKLTLTSRFGLIKYNESKIICLTGNFHGRTLGTISLSDYENYKKGFGPLLNNIIQVKMNCTMSLYNAIEKYHDVCSIIYEPIQGEGGINPIFPKFYESIY